MYLFPKAALFDLDGTLIHNEHDFFFPELCEIYQKLGKIPPSREDFDKMVSNHALFSDIEESEKPEFSEQFWIEFESREFPLARAIPGSIETLEHFVSGGARVAIITARTHLPEDVEHTLQDTGLLKYLEVISTLGEPHLLTRQISPELKLKQIKHVCKLFSVEPKGSVVFGDSPSDITSGKAAGVSETVGLLSGGLAREVLAKAEPDLLVDVVSESIDYFPKHS